jgi:hypothetical protein
VKAWKYRFAGLNEIIIQTVAINTWKLPYSESEPKTKPKMRTEVVMTCWPSGPVARVKGGGKRVENFNSVELSVNSPVPRSLQYA